MSETVAAGVTNTKDHTKVGTIGRAIQGTDIRTDAETGEIQIKSDIVFAGYLNLPEKQRLNSQMTIFPHRRCRRN